MKGWSKLQGTQIQSILCCSHNKRSTSPAIHVSERKLHLVAGYIFLTLQKTSSYFGSKHALKSPLTWVDKWGFTFQGTQIQSILCCSHNKGSTSPAIHVSERKLHLVAGHIFLTLQKTSSYFGSKHALKSPLIWVD